MPSSQGLRPAKVARRIARANLADRHFDGNHRRNAYERITLFVETFIASDQIEEAKLSHANIPRSESRSFDSDLLEGRIFRGAHFVFALSGRKYEKLKPLLYIGRRTPSIFCLHVLFVAGTRIVLVKLFGIS